MAENIGNTVFKNFRVLDEKIGILIEKADLSNEPSKILDSTIVGRSITMGSRIDREKE